MSDSEKVEQSPSDATSDNESAVDNLRTMAAPDADATLQLAGKPADGSAAGDVGESTSSGARFKILRPHARGGLGEVFVAADGELPREVALKQIRARHADDADSRARFVQEAEITGGLEHPNIVPVYGLGTYADGRPYYAMRFIRGESLEQAVRRYHDLSSRNDKSNSAAERSLEFRKLLQRFIEVCNAIEYAHSRGIVHRDLKPGNIMLGKFGETLVVDWGLAKALGGGANLSQPMGEEGALSTASAVGSVATQYGAAVGTPAYMSPEQAAGRLDQIGPASDVYSLGATLYHVLTGRPPLEGSDLGAVLRRAQHGDIPPPRRVRHGVPLALEGVCLKAMALRPEDRYPSARALADDLEHWLADEPVSACREPWGLRASRWARRHKAIAVGAVSLLAAACIALGVGYVVVSREQARTTQAQRERALTQVEALLDANPQAVANILDGLEPFHEWVLPRLRELRSQADLSDDRKIRVSLALLPVDRGEVNYLRERLLDCPIGEFPVICDRLSPYKENLTAVLWQRFRDSTTGGQTRFQAGMALALFAPDAAEWTDDDAQFLAGQLTSANPDYQRDLRSHLQPIAGRLLRPLQATFRDGGAREGERRSAAAALIELNRDDAELLAGLVCEAPPELYGELFEALAAADRSRAGRALESRVAEQSPADVAEAERIAAGKRRAGAALTLLRINDVAAACRIFPCGDDPEALTQFVHGARDRGLKPLNFYERFDDIADEQARFAFLLALGEFGLDEVSEHDRAKLVERFSRLHRDDPSAAVHGAAGRLLRNWGQRGEVEVAERTPLPLDPTGRRRWFVERLGDDHQTFVVVPPGEFVVGSLPAERNRGGDETRHPVRLTRGLAMADREVTRGQFERFLKATGHSLGNVSALADCSPTDRHAMLLVNWYDAVLYCRWLTTAAGLTEADQCYDDPAKIEKGPDGMPLDWPFHPERNGFRLPTEAEWEVACRCGTLTPYSFGGDLTLLDRYAWLLDNSARSAHPGGELRPNLHGLFDMHGNVFEWCHDRLGDYPAVEQVDPIGPDAGDHRVARGGGWNVNAAYCRSANRDHDPPSLRHSSMGFRICRTIEFDVPK